MKIKGFTLTRGEMLGEFKAGARIKKYLVILVSRIVKNEIEITKENTGPYKGGE